MLGQGEALGDVERAELELLVVLAGSLGVVTGRALRRPLLAIIIGAFTWFLLFGAYWVWNSPPLNVVTPAQSTRVAFGSRLSRSFRNVIAVTAIPTGTLR